MPEVSKVNPVSAKRNPKDDAHLLFSVHFTGDKTSLFPDLAKRIQLYMAPGEVFELVRGNESMDEMYCAGHCVLYEKK